MEVFLISLIVIEILFLILGEKYIYKSYRLNEIKRAIIIFMYFAVFLLFNISIIKTITLNYFNLTELKNNIGLLTEKKKDYNKKLDEINKIYEEVYNDLNSLNYVTLKEENDALEKDITDYKKKINLLEIDIEKLENELKKLSDEYKLLEEQSKYIIEDFPTYHQFPNYPNGCESVSLYLLLKYHNIDVTVEEIVTKLKKGDSPYRKKGVLYGGDPEVEFIGDPRLKSGYGVYEKPIIDVANQFKSGIKNIKGTSLNDVLKIVKTGKPVQVWASINLKNTYTCAKWQSTSTNRIIEWKCGLHSLVIIGYTYNEIITSDPYTGEVEYYPKKQFEKIYDTYGKRAIYYE